MAAEKRIYSTTALQNCYRALRSARWSVRRKDEHMTRCCEVRELYAKCQLTPPTIEIVGFPGGGGKAYYHAAYKAASYAVSHHPLRV